MLLNYDLYIKLTYILCTLYCILKDIENKYIIGGNIIIFNTVCKKYDKIHDLYILFCIFNIKILTYRSKNYIKYITYMNEELISELTVINNEPVNKKIEIIRTIIFIDDINIINTLIIFNCGIIIHYNNYINHIYNYIGNRRTIEKIEYNENINFINSIKYI